MFFFFNDTATTEIYTLSLHDALPILRPLPPDVARSALHCGLRSHRRKPGRHAHPLPGVAGLLHRVDAPQLAALAARRSRIYALGLGAGSRARPLAHVAGLARNAVCGYPHSGALR